MVMLVADAIPSQALTSLHKGRVIDYSKQPRTLAVKRAQPWSVALNLGNKCSLSELSELCKDTARVAAIQSLKAALSATITI